MAASPATPEQSGTSYSDPARYHTNTPSMADSLDAVDSGLNDALTQPNHELPATTAVMGINELLQHILLQVPPEHMTSLRKVAKTWNYIISSINRVFPVDNCICGLDHSGICADCNQFVPHYSSHITFKCNPMVFDYQDYDMGYSWLLGTGPTANRRFNEFELKEGAKCRKLPPAKLARTREQFITDPPITIISLDDGKSDKAEKVAMMHVPSGIRVGDLLDVFAKMDAQVDYDVDRRRSPRSAYFPLASFACDVDFDWAKVREEANTNMKA